MSAPESPAAHALRRGFRYLNRWMLLLWRLHLGPLLSLAPPIAGRYLVLGHTGRKSGQMRRTPLNYARVGDTIYIVAGFGAVSDWYKNILAHPYVELWLPGGRWAGRAVEIAADDPARLNRMRAVLRGSGFAAFLAGVNPYTRDDARLARLTADYRLIAIRPERSLT